jgi:hypothetical protein
VWIIRQADLAMYRANGQDQSSVVFFEPPATLGSKYHLTNLTERLIHAGQRSQLMRDPLLASVG